MAIIIQEIKESWEELLEQLSDSVVKEPGKLCSYGFIRDEDFNNSYAEFRLTGKPYAGANRTLVLTTAWSSFTYQFFSRLSKHFVVYNGGRQGYLAQNLLPKITPIGVKKTIDLDEIG
jgi:hypothetical protein